MLLVYTENQAVAAAVAQGLRAAGCETVRAESVYAAVVALAVEPARFAAALLALDFFNREELRFFPMAKRRWPDLLTVALTEPAFAYKAAIADLAGADFLCTDSAGAGEIVARLTADFRKQSSERQSSDLSPQTSGTTKEEATAVSPSSAGGFDDNGRAPTRVAPADDELIIERKRRGPRQAQVTEPPVVRVPLADLPQKSAALPARQDILTEEELAALMENMEEDDLPNE
jgi:hypothetical protein